MPGSVMNQEVNSSRSNFCSAHVSVQTTEKYLGCKRRLREAVNDRLGIEPTPDLV